MTFVQRHFTTGLRVCKWVILSHDIVKSYYEISNDNTPIQEGDKTGFP